MILLRVLSRVGIGRKCEQLTRVGANVIITNLIIKHHHIRFVAPNTMSFNATSDFRSGGISSWWDFVSTWRWNSRPPASDDDELGVPCRLDCWSLAHEGELLIIELSRVPAYWSPAANAPNYFSSLFRFVRSFAGRLAPTWQRYIKTTCLQLT